MSSTQLPRVTAAYVERRLTQRSRNIETKQTHVHRERDFGVGYGNSSGYASNRTYATPATALFRYR